MVTISSGLLRRLAPNADAAILLALVAPLNAVLQRYGIVTSLRVAHFLAQTAEETDGFRTLHEYASGKAYEGRKDLGNTQPGDGPRFKGRGVIQITGRAAYGYYGKLLGLDLIGNPELAANPETSVKIACLYWYRMGLNAWADKDDIRAITYRINGGYNGLASRRAYLVRAKELLGVAADAAIAVDDPSTEPASPVTPLSPSPTPPWWQGWDMGGLAMAGIGSLGTLFSGASGVAAWALLILVVGGLALAGYLILQKRHEGQK